MASNEVADAIFAAEQYAKAYNCSNSRIHIFCIAHKLHIVDKGIKWIDAFFLC
ncbi:hypothetical protein [Virgibacillus alimentarius]|uniref:Uncharacterized protein n=1 Tax=Virgibacillus alimentarius TaxID=698769 RepID=A0ABS4S8J9_9BACI|nr:MULTISPECIES: hypothetical protein [Virgibacillus]MBP2257818.1 hypothetical protein [Virgibacillus alimentarius]HLR67681.1 hypothetical protein [Virgibacillus sp.]